MKLIGLHARLHAGKDTAYEAIDKHAMSKDLLAVRRAFADPLKISGMRALGFPVDYDNDTLLYIANQIKETGRITVSYEHGSGELESRSITGRKLWQLYGTEAHRAEDLGSSFGTNFWVNNLLPLGEDRGHPAWAWNFTEDWAGFGDFCVVTDVRFSNEAERILELGGEVWKIDAENRLGPNEDGHASEQPLDDEWITREIDNNGSIEDFHANVIAALEEGTEDVDD